MNKKIKIDLLKKATLKNPANHAVSGCIGICSAWLDEGMKETPVEMAAFVERLIVSSVKALK